MKTAYEAKQSKDMDLFVNMVNNDHAHVARAKAKAKAKKVRQEKRAAYEKSVRNDSKLERSAGAALAATGLWALVLAAFA